MSQTRELAKNKVLETVRFQSPEGRSASPEIDRLVEEIIGRIADKWTLLLLEALAQHGVVRFSRLAELVGELYLTEGKKKEKLWESAAAAMRKLGVPESRVEHLMKKEEPTLLAEVVKELV